MASMPVITADTIALTEKKMDMTLDDIIKMSKKTSQKTRKQQTSNKSQRAIANKYGATNTVSKVRVQQSVAARSSALRQGKLAELRSRNGTNQLAAVKEAARRAAVTPIRTTPAQWKKRRNGPLITQGSRPFSVVSSTKVNAPVKQRPQTLDSLFANMKEQRMRAQQAQTGGRQTNFATQQRNFGGWQRNFFGYQRNFTGRQRSN